MFYMLTYFYLFSSFQCFIRNALPDTIFLGHIWIFVTNLGFSIRIPDNLYKSIMITLYNLANIQNKAQKAWEQFEKRQWRKFRFRQKKFRLQYQYQNFILVSVADTEPRFRSYTTATYECIKETSFIHHLTKDLGLVFLPHSSMPIVFEFKVIFQDIYIQ